MKRTIKITLSLFLFSNIVYATNGDNMIGVGPTSNSMGGVGISKAQDSISAIFANPATITQLEESQFDFAGTYFIPTVKANVNAPGLAGIWSGKSQDKAYAIPAIGLTNKINEKLFFGIGAYGVSGMGVDYKGIDSMDTNTKLSLMKFVPAIAYKNGNISYGLGLDIDYQAADFGSGLSHNYALGIRLGTNYQINNWIFGIIFVTPQDVNHERIYDFDNNGKFDNLKLENPMQYGFGISNQITKKLMTSLEVKYLDWANAKGYKDFDWESQFVYALGLSYKASEKFTFRAGYNYGKNPVKVHNNFNPSSSTNIQGTNMNTFGYEYFRIIGFPAIVENHITCGLGYKINERVFLNLGYKHAFEKSIKEVFATGFIESKLSENAFDFGLNFKF